LSIYLNKFRSKRRNSALRLIDWRRNRATGDNGEGKSYFIGLFAVNLACPDSARRKQDDHNEKARSWRNHYHETTCARRNDGNEGYCLSRTNHHTRAWPDNYPCARTDHYSCTRTKNDHT